MSFSLTRALSSSMPSSMSWYQKCINCINIFSAISGSTKVATFAYSHQANRLVERNNKDKELCRWMECMLYNKRMDKANWEVALPFAVRIHNASPIGTIKYSPGSSLMLDKKILLPKENASSSAMLSWGKDRRALQDYMIKEAQEQQKRKQVIRSNIRVIYMEA